MYNEQEEYFDRAALMAAHYSGVGIGVLVGVTISIMFWVCMKG